MLVPVISDAWGIVDSEHEHAEKYIFHILTKDNDTCMYEFVCFYVYMYVYMYVCICIYSTCMST